MKKLETNAMSKIAKDATWWLAFCFAGIALGQGVDSPSGVFQMEGNASSDNTICFLPSTGTGSGITNPGLATPGPGGTCPSGYTLVTFTTTNDWNSRGSALAFTGFVNDLTNSQSDTSYQGGSSKDIYDVSLWRWKGAKASQAKDDIAHAYAAAYVMPSGPRAGHTIIVVGLDRWDGSGAATAGFWFFQDGSIATNNNAGGGADGGFNGTHTDGDLLIVSDFNTGGAVSNIAVFKWVGNGTNGSLVFQEGVSTGNATCDPTTGTQGLCGISNPVTVPSILAAGYSFSDKSGSTNFLQGEFLEIALDLNDVFSSPPCFTRFLAETRASNAPNSTLSDFSGPTGFPLCSLGVTKACTSAGIVGGNEVQYNFGGNITNTGVGTLYNAMLTDTPPTGFVAGSLSTSVPDTSGGIAAGNSVAYTGSFKTTAILGTNDKNSVSVTASSSSASGAAQNVGPATADWGPTSCSPAITATLTLAKTCKSCLVSGSGGLVVNVGEAFKVCNTGNVNITGISVQDCRGTVSGSPGSQTCSAGSFVSIATGQSIAAGGACLTFTSSYTPTSIGACSSGQCSFADQAIASGTAALGGGTVYANGGTPVQASCPLCPIATDCTAPAP